MLLARKLLSSIKQKVVLFFDTFTDPNGTNIVLHTPDIDLNGGGWYSVAGSGDIQSNRLRISTNATIGFDPGAADRTITLYSYDNPLSYIIVFAKRQDSTNSMQVYFNGTQIVLREQIGGLLFSRASYSFSPSNPDDFTFVINTINTNITLNFSSISGSSTTLSYGSMVLSGETAVAIQNGSNLTRYDNLEVVE